MQVNVEILPEGGDSVGDLGEGEERLSALLDREITPTLAMPETVTVTLTQNPDAGKLRVGLFLGGLFAVCPVTDSDALAAECYLQTCVLMPPCVDWVNLHCIP